jgi:hypothetical protein
MARPQFSTARLRARRTQRPLPIAGDLDSSWLELGASELRLRRDGGDVLWSVALPDQALAGYELAAADLASLEDDEDLEEVTLERT